MKKLVLSILALFIIGLFVACNQDVTVDAQVYANVEVGTFVLNGQNYATLQEAVNAKLGKGVKSSKATSEQEADVIYLMRNASGPGAVIDGGTVIIDFNDFTYSFTNVTGLQGGDNPKAETFGLGITSGADVTLKGLQQIDLFDTTTTDLTMVYVAGQNTKLTIEDAPKMKVEDDQYVFWAADGATLTIGSTNVSDEASITGKVAATGGASEDSKPTVTVQGATTLAGGVKAESAKVTLSGISKVTGTVEATSTTVTISDSSSVSGTIEASGSKVAVNDAAKIDVDLTAKNNSEVVVNTASAGVEASTIKKMDKDTDSTVVVAGGGVNVEEVVEGSDYKIEVGDDAVVTGDDVQPQPMTSYLAKIEGKGLYTTFEEAVDKADNNDTIILLGDIAEEVTIPENLKVSVNLKSCSIGTNINPVDVVIEGDITITAAEGGVLYASNMTLSDGSSTTLEGGEFHVETPSVVGSLTITGGTYYFYPGSFVPGYCEMTPSTPEGPAPWVVKRVSKADAVAEIEGKYYLSLKTAIDSAESGQTILLLKDYDMEANEPGYGWTTAYWAVSANSPGYEDYTRNNKIFFNKSDVTFDLSGYSITNIYNNTFAVNADRVTIKNGVLRVGKLYYCNAGKPESPFTSDDDKTCSYVLQVVGGTDLVIDSLTTYGGINISSGGLASINNLEFSGTKFYAVCSQDSSTVVLNGGIYDKSLQGAAKYLFWIQTGSSMTIKGGEYIKGSGNFSNEQNPVIMGGKYDFDPTNYGVAEGYKARDNGDGTWTVVPKFVASLNGTTKYKTLQAAIDAATTAGDEVSLLDDIEGEDVTVAEGQTITIDFKEFTLTGLGSSSGKDAALINNGNLTLKGSGTYENNSITKANIRNDYVAIKNTGTLTVESGTYLNDGSGGVFVNKCGSMTIGSENGLNTDVVLQRTGTSVSGYMIATYGTSAESRGTTVVNAITMYGDKCNGAFYNSTFANLTIEKADVDIVAPYYLIYIGEGSSATVNGGSFRVVRPSASWQQLFCLWANVCPSALYINGGTFVFDNPTGAGTPEYILNNTEVDLDSNPTVNITGGLFTKTSDAYTTPTRLYFDHHSKGLDVNLSGGRFKTQDFNFGTTTQYPAYNLPDNYVVLFDSVDGMYYVHEVTVDEAVAQIVREEKPLYFMTLQAAIDAAISEETITLLRSIEESSTIQISKSVTIDGDGNTITNTKSGTKSGSAFRCNSDSYIDVNILNLKLKTTNYNYGLCFNAYARGCITNVSIDSDGTSLAAFSTGSKSGDDVVGASSVDVYNSTIVHLGESGDPEWTNTAVAVGQGGSVTIYSGTVKGKYGLFCYSSGGHITVAPENDSDVTVESTVCDLYIDYSNFVTGVVDISGGTFKNAVVKGQNNGGCPIQSILNITGGVFYSFSQGGYVDINISGGIFNSDPANSFIETGCTKSLITEGEYEGWWEVYAVASVTHEGNVTYFNSLQGAIDAAESGDTVDLLQDVTEGDIALSKAITINGNSHIISWTYTSINESIIKIGSSDVTNRLSGKITIKDISLISDNYKNYCRGLNIQNMAEGSKLILDQVSISIPHYYAINIMNRNNGLSVSMNHCSIKGWCTIYNHSDGVYLKATDCELDSDNPEHGGGDSNSFSNVIVSSYYHNDGTSDEDTNKDNSFYFENCSFTASKSYPEADVTQQVCDLRSPCNNSVSFNGCSFSKLADPEYIIVCSYSNYNGDRSPENYDNSNTVTIDGVDVSEASFVGWYADI